MILLSPTQEMASVRRAAMRAGCTVRELSVQETTVGPRAIGRIDCPDGWGAARLLLAQALEDSKTAGARDVALSIRRDYPSDREFAEAVHAYVKANVAFVREQGEVFTGSAYTLATQGGDCDDHARLVFALAMAGGLPAMIAFLHEDKPHADPSHAVAQLCVDGVCHWAETTVDAEFGEHPLSAAARLGLLDQRGDLSTEVRIMSEKSLGSQEEADHHAFELLGFVGHDERVTSEIVRAVQREIGGLVVDGLLGPKTRHAIALRLPQNEFGMGYLSALGALAAAPDLSDAFFTAWVEMCQRLGLDPVDLARVAFAETQLRADAHEPVLNGGGLIGFMPSTLSGLGWKGTPEEFRRLSAVEQVPWVERFYKSKPTRLMKNDRLVYVANFLPALLKDASESDDDFVLATADGSGPLQPPDRDKGIYKQNKVLDRNHDGVITVGDMALHLDKQDKGPRYDAIIKRLVEVMKEKGLTCKAGVGCGAPGPSPERVPDEDGGGGGGVAVLLVVGAGAAAAWYARSKGWI